MGGEGRKGKGKRGEGRVGEQRGREVVFSLCVYFGLLRPFSQAYRDKGKAHFKFLYWILKLVWDLFPYAIVTLMFTCIHYESSL